MEGGEYTRWGRQGRPGLRRAAVLLVAFGALAGVLTGALLICARAGGPHAPAGVRAHGTARGTAHGTPRAVCASPYDLPGCSTLAHGTAAVLPVPPPAVTLAESGAAPARTSGGAGRIRPPEPLARAPDLHALQVLRT